MPLLFERKKAASFSNFFVYVKVSPVADENLLVCSCSSDKIGLLNFLSATSFPLLFPYLVDPDFADGANLICIPPLGGLLGEEVSDSLSSFFLASSAS